MQKYLHFRSWDEVWVPRMQHHYSERCLSYKHSRALKWKVSPQALSLEDLALSASPGPSGFVCKQKEFFLWGNWSPLVKFLAGHQSSCGWLSRMCFLGQWTSVPGILAARLCLWGREEHAFIKTWGSLKMYLRDRGAEGAKWRDAVF